MEVGGTDPTVMKICVSLESLKTWLFYFFFNMEHFMNLHVILGATLICTIPFLVYVLQM